MATQLQSRRGTTAQMNAFTGAEGEIAVNTSTDTLHVHDGSTAGGHALAKADGSNIATYAGSFTTISASGAITGNVTGNLTGNVTGNVTGDLTGSVLTAAQTNITSLGTLSTLAVTGASTLTGAVGINIAPTSYKLTVNSGATTEATAAAIGYNGDAGTNLYINTDHGNNLVSLYASGDVSKEMRFLSGTLEVMRLGTTGNVGISNSNPPEMLTLGSTSDTNVRLQFLSSTTGGNTIQFGDGAGAGAYAGYINYTHSDDVLAFATGGSEAMRISGSNVGIGTSSPTSPNDATSFLHIGNATNQDTSIVLQDAVETWEIYQNDDLSFLFDTTNVMTLQRLTGNVGIGTMLAGAALHVDPAANVTTGLGTPLIKVGGDNSWAGNGSIYSIGFGYVDSSVSNKSPAEIGFSTTSSAGYTKGDLVFATRDVTTNSAPTERMRLTSGGLLQAKGPATNYISNSEYHQFIANIASIAMYVFNSNSAAGAAGILINVGNERSDANGYFIRGYSNSTARDNIYIYTNGDVSNRNGTYSQFSDVKLKQDISDANNQWQDFKSIQFRKYRFKDDVASDENAPYHLGVVAQELEAAGLNGLVTESPDKEFYESPVTDDDGNAVLDEDGNAVTEQQERLTGETTKSVKMSILYAKGMVALQEAMARIETLEAKVQTLENN